MRRRLRSRSIACLTIYFCFLLPVFAQADPPKQPISLHMKGVSLLDVLGKLSIDYRIPIGFQYATDDEKNATNVEIDVTRVTLVEVLDLIAKQAPKYRWETRNGVINFVPIQNHGEFFEKFLNTRISHFAPKRGINKFEVRN